MMDLNFFEPYIDKREFKFNKIVLLYALLILSIVGIATLGAFNQVQINMLQKQANDRRLIAEDPNTVSKYNEIKELENQMTVFKGEVDRIIRMDKNIAQTNIISEDLISEIQSKMPDGLFLTDFSASGKNVQISGVAKESNSIAEFSKGLGLIDDVESVFISNIDNHEESYNFVLSTTFKEVDIDEQAQD